MMKDHYVVTIDVKHVTFKPSDPASRLNRSDPKTEDRRVVDDTMHVVLRRSTLPELVEATVAVMQAGE
jgi:hypothetical protein